jgi:D-sedoheptulose 7-phosphate isomerase
MIEIIRRVVSDSIDLKKSFFAANEARIVAVAHALCKALQRGNKILLYGNGGSAADAQHIAAEFVGRFQLERYPLAAIALTTDTSVITSLSNDYGFSEIFARQMRALGRQADVSIAISTSGNSPNVLLANSTAREMGLITVGLTGKDGGELGAQVEHHLCVPHKTTARIQEMHIMIGHILCELVDEHLKEKRSANV